MKKTFKAIALVVILAFSFYFIGCNQKPADDPILPPDNGQNEQELPVDFSSVKFENKTVTYNGKVQTLSVDEATLPQGATVTYKNNENKDAGTYEVTATVSVKSQSKDFKATLTIEKLKVYFKVTAKQSFDYNGNVIYPTYQIIDNDFNSISDVEVEYSSLNTLPGTYEVVISCKENPNYVLPSSAKVTLTINEMTFSNISFESKSVVADGATHSITIDESLLPSGYSCTYSNNSASTKGTYYAICSIKNDKGDVVSNLQAILTIDNPDNEEFKAYVDEFFVLYLEGDQLAVNIFLVHPENFGILEHYDAVWYTYSNEDTYAEGKQHFEDLLAEFNQFDVTTLSENDMISYRCIKEFLESNLMYYQNKEFDLMGLNYIDQFGGMPADFATYMEAYAIRTEQDAKDIVSYTLSLPDAFRSYTQYVLDKEKAGYAISQYTINEMKNYLKEVLDDGENYYLIEVVCSNIDKAECLTSEQKDYYKTQFTNAMHTEFIDAYTILHDFLASYVSPVTTEGYLQSYGDLGKELYLIRLKDLLGVSEIDTAKYIAYLDKAIKTSSQGIDQAMKDANNLGQTQYNQFALYATGKSSLVNINDVEKMLPYLKEFAKHIVPELKTDPTITLSELDPTVQERTTTVAYYMKSALDSTDTESIHTNPHYLAEDINDTLSTLAHEGYPGHLYNFVYTKESNMSNLAKIMTNTCYGEGWATYVSLALYDYIKTHTSNKAIKAACDYLIHNEIIGYALYARIDAGIHLEGWGVSKIANYLDSMGFNGEAAQDVFRTLIEIPTQYVSYGFGIVLFYDMHNSAKSQLGSHYNEVEFNKMILDLGWCNMETLYNTYLKYVNDVKFENKLN